MITEKKKRFSKWCFRRWGLYFTNLVKFFWGSHQGGTWGNSGCPVLPRNNRFHKSKSVTSWGIWHIDWHSITFHQSESCKHQAVPLLPDLFKLSKGLESNFPSYFFLSQEITWLLESRKSLVMYEHANLNLLLFNSFVADLNVMSIPHSHLSAVMFQPFAYQISTSRRLKKINIQRLLDWPLRCIWNIVICSPYPSKNIYAVDWLISDGAPYKEKLSRISLKVKNSYGAWQVWIFHLLGYFKIRITTQDRSGKWEAFKGGDIWNDLPEEMVEAGKISRQMWLA